MRPAQVAACLVRASGGRPASCQPCAPSRIAPAGRRTRLPAVLCVRGQRPSHVLVTPVPRAPNGVGQTSLRRCQARSRALVWVAPVRWRMPISGEPDSQTTTNHHMLPIAVTMHREPSAPIPSSGCSNPHPYPLDVHRSGAIRPSTHWGVRGCPDALHSGSC